MAVVNPYEQAGTQANGAAGSQTQASITNAAMQSGGRSRGVNPAMAAASSAAQSYKNAAAPPIARGAGAQQTAAAPAPAPAGPPAPVAGGGYEGANYKTPYGPASDQWLNQMQQDVRASQAQTMQDQMRALSAKMAGTPGMVGGAQAAAMADLYRKGGLGMQEQLSTAMLGQYGDERNRLAQAWATEGGWATQKTVAQMQADAQAAAASASANASMYNADLDYRLGMTQADINRELGLGDLDLRQGQLGLGYYTADQGYAQNLMELMAQMGGTNWGNVSGGPGWTQSFDPSALLGMAGGG